MVSFQRRELDAKVSLRKRMELAAQAENDFIAAFSRCSRMGEEVQLGTVFVDDRPTRYWGTDVCECDPFYDYEDYDNEERGRRADAVEYYLQTVLGLTDYYLPFYPEDLKREKEFRRMEEYHSEKSQVTFTTK